MSYKLYSITDLSVQNLSQWNGRSVSGEVNSCYNRTLAVVLEEFLTKPNMKILEAGCGLGGWVQYLREKGHQVTGVEYESKVIEMVKAYDASFPIEQDNVSGLRFSDNSFDVYISLGVIEHYEEGPQKILQEAKRVLKTSGLAFITVPYLNIFRRFCAHPMRTIYLNLRRFMKKEDHFAEYRYTINELSSFLRELNFEIIKIDIDDYDLEDRKHHMGMYTDFFFLRKKAGEVWELNILGKIFLKMVRV